MKLSDVLNEKSKGLWHNIHAKRKRGEKPAKPGDNLQGVTPRSQRCTLIVARKIKMVL